MVLSSVDLPRVKQLAASGHFRSIALWLNYSLVAQGIQAVVQPDARPAYLHILLESPHPLAQEPLIKFVCRQIGSLKAPAIHGLYLVACTAGQSQWQQRIRFKRSPRVPRSQPRRHTPSPQPEIIATAVTSSSEDHQGVPASLQPRPSVGRRRRHGQRQHLVQQPAPVVQIRSADPAQITKQASRRRARLPKAFLEQQFRYMRATVVTGSAAAAFILGCLTEVIFFNEQDQVAQTQPALTDSGWRHLSDTEVQEIAYRTAGRGPVVETALETVAVVPHKSIQSSDDPTVTLMFGGEIPVGEAPLQAPEAVDQVLTHIDSYQSADVAMVSLGNSLAQADTSLQEEYLERSRPDAVDALRQGGIDIVGITSDRTMEFGNRGLTETLEALDSAGIYRVGAGRDSQEARRPEILDVKGQRIAYLSYAPNSDIAATPDYAGLNVQDRQGIKEDIAAIRPEVDWVVVNYRWQQEIGDQPDAQQVDLSRSAIDAGADLVVGYHAQQLQGAELYKQRPIIYSLGDFVFPDTPLEDRDTAALRVSLRQKQMKLEFLPVKVEQAQPRAATGDTAKAILKQVRQASEQLPQPLQFPTILEVSPAAPAPEKPIPAPPVREVEPTAPRPLVEAAPIGEPLPAAPGLDSWGAPNLEQIEQLQKSVDSAPLPGEQTQPLNGEAQPDHSQEIAEPELTPSPLPGVQQLVEPAQSEFLEFDDALDTPTPGAAPADLAPESLTDELPAASDPETILAPDDSLIEGYEDLQEWGQKSSPHHQQFKPIQEQLQSGADQPAPQLVKPLSLQQPSAAEEADSLGAATEDTNPEAISPHDEPLVGPLS